MIRALVFVFFALAAAIGLAACASTPVIQRVDPGQVLDYQVRFDEDDAREASRSLIDDALARPWIEQWRRAHGGRPIVIVGSVANDTSDYIDASLITTSLERALLNSGDVALVAAAGERGQVRTERRAQQDWSRPETVKRMAHELGADLMLVGRIGENVEVTPDRRRRIQYYQISLELVNVESNEKVWIGTHEIEKRRRG